MNTKDNKQNRILIAGTMAFDEIITQSASSGRVIGGAATYISYSSSFFTNNIYVSSIIGNDFPLSFLDEMNSKGISTEMIEIAKEKKSFFWRGEYKDDFNTRVTHDTQLNALELYRPNLSKGANDFKLVMLGNLDPGIQMDILSQVRNDDKFVILDTMNYWIDNTEKKLSELISKADLIVINDEEAKMLGKSHSLQKCAEDIMSCGPEYVIVKKGSEGAELFSKKQKSEIPAFRIKKVVDPTGAGDSFAGGICGYLSSSPKIDFVELHNSMIYGTVIASFCIQDFGVVGLQKLKAENLNERMQTFNKYLL